MVKKTGRPGYLQIADDLRGQITDGQLAPGDALPSLAQLSREYEASVSVVKSAISVLRTEGLVVGQQGKGVFVREGANAGTQAEPDEDTPLMKQLDQVLTAVRDLGERVAVLEQQVFPEQPPRRRPGK